MRRSYLNGKPAGNLYKTKNEMVVEDDTCMSCFQNTKYECIDCNLPLCNHCSIDEIEDSTPGWLAMKRVGHC